MRHHLLVWFVQSGLKAQPRGVLPLATVAQLHPLSVIMVADTLSINAKSPIRNISYQEMRTEMIQIFTGGTVASHRIFYKPSVDVRKYLDRTNTIM